MQAEAIAVMQESSRGSMEGTTTFPDVVRRLTEIGAESYHLDFYRREKTYYFPNEETYVEPMNLPPLEIAGVFSEDGMKAVLHRVQNREITFPQFLEASARAGCTGYQVYIAGRKTRYFGRSGECYAENFPFAAQ